MPSVMNFSLQYMTEKIGGAEGTKLDVDFVDMERVSDVFLCELERSVFHGFRAVLL